MSALNSFGTKIGNGIGAALVGIILGAFGYDSVAAASNAAQPASAILGIKLLYSFIPACAYLLIVIILHFYKLERLLPELRAKAQKETAAE